MNELLELLKIIIPSLVILGVVFVLMREFTKHNSKQIQLLEETNKLQYEKMANELKTGSSKITIPLKFQAYERMVLFLERITPQNLLTRVMKHPVSVDMLHSKLLATIREEYEHNMSQQLYVSDNAWDKVKSAKEDILRIINTSASKFKSDDSSSDFAREIIIEFGKSDNKLNNALFALKEDIRKHFS